MKKLAEFTIKYRYPVLILVLASVGWLGYEARNIKMNNDMSKWLDPSDPAIKLYMRTGDKFGSNYINMVILKMDDVFTTEHLQLVRKLTESYEAITGVDQVLSLTNILDVRPTDDGMEVKPLVAKGPITKDKKALSALKKYVLAKERFRGFMINRTGSATLLMVRLRLHADKDKVSHLLSVKANGIIPKGRGIDVYMGGMPMAIYFANKLVNQDMGRLTPIVTLLILLVLFASFRSVKGTMLPLVTVLLATVATIGLMAVFHVALTMISASLPVILLATGTAYGIHLINADREIRIQGVVDSHQRVVTAMDNVGLAIILAAVTTMFGFGSLATAQLVPIQNMGIFLAAGIFISLLLTFFMVVPILAVWKGSARPLSTKEKAHNGYLEKVLRVIAASVTSRPWAYALTALVIALVFLGFATQMTREANLTNYFPPDNPVRQAEKIMKQEFGGATPVVVDFEAKSIKNPGVLRVMQRVQKAMRATPHLKHPSSVVDFMSEMNFVMNHRRSTPTTQQGVDNLWIFIEGKKELSQMIDDPKKEAIIQGTLDQSNSDLMARVTGELEKRLKTVPARIVAIDRNRVDAPANKKLAAIITRDALLEMQDDLAYAGIKIKDIQAVRKAMLDVAIGTALAPDTRHRVIETAVNRYMMSDSAELEVDRAVAKAVAKALSGLLKWDKGRVLAILKEKIPAQQWKDDPGSLPAMVGSLSAVFTNAVDGAQVARVRKVLVKNLVKPLNKAIPEVQQRVDADLWELREKMAYISVKDYGQAMGKPPGPGAITRLKTTLTGEAKVMTNENNQLINSQAKSLVIAMLFVLILIGLQFRSFTGGLLAMIPIVFTILFNFGLMGMFKIPLDNATAMIASAAIGLGIDYTIHVMLRFKKEFEIVGDTKKALEATLATSGRAVLVNSLAVTLGFLVLLFSEMEPLRRFGYLMAITMVVSAVSALTVFPATMLVTKAKFLTRSSGPKEAK